MSIPVVKGSKAVAVLAVANKKTDYEEKNIPHLSLFLESMWDMIMRKKAEEELHTLNEQLEQKVEERTKQLITAQEELVRKEKLAVLGRLAGIVGHEIRNPWGVMNNAVYFLKTVMTDATDTVKEYLDIIKQEIDNSQRIITDLLDFARTKTPQMTPVAVNELVIKVLGKYAVAGNIDVQTDITEALPEVKVDSFQMGQVLRNLITNAVQAMPGGGSLRISAREVQGARRKVQGRDEENLEPSTLNLEPDTDFVEISVKDTGEGISPENMEKLFQPLFTTKTKGIGLGLTICKNLTEANGGRIEVESRLGIGTTFKIIIPIGG
jgi:signal transduction histidine kinase